MITKCIICGTQIDVYPSRLKIGKGKCCSKECQKLHKSQCSKGEKNGNWREEVTVSSAGYKMIHGNKQHRQIAAQRLGRALTKKDVVHHINGIKTDNSPNNLAVMTHSEHAHAHASIKLLLPILMAEGIIKFKDGIYVTIPRGFTSDLP